MTWRVHILNEMRAGVRVAVFRLQRYWAFRAGRLLPGISGGIALADKTAANTVVTWKVPVY